MKNNKIIPFVLLSLSGLFIFSGCTDLDETIYHDSNTNNFYNSKSEVISAVLRPYTHSAATFAQNSRQNCWMLNEFSADQLAWPVKGIHGYDDGRWIQLHYHAWDNTHQSIEDCWNLLFMGLGFCNDAITNLNSRNISHMGITEDEKNKFIAELRANRAYYYLNAIDIFGNVPIVTTVENTAPATNSRLEVFNFIESELLAVVDNLPLLNEVNSGRLTRAAAYAMLAELYLNAKIWIGTDRWDDCIRYCDLIMSGNGGAQHGSIKLDTGLLTPFCNTNTQDSQENIFVLSYDNAASGVKCGWNGHFYHFNQRYIYDGTENGNNGVVVIPSSYDLYADNDLRKKEWMLIGPQYYYEDPSKPIEGKAEYSGKPLIFVKEIQRLSEGGTESTMYTGEENSGARFNKYRPGSKSDPNYWSNDWVFYRLTEIYYFKAEALIRKNGNIAPQEAVDLVNTCRKRAFTENDWVQAQYTTATLTMDEFLAERGREFIFEGKRRKDLIRFDKFLTDTWWDHVASNNEHLKLYPIPYNQVILNSNLVQNPGY